MNNFTTIEKYAIIKVLSHIIISGMTDENKILSKVLFVGMVEADGIIHPKETEIINRFFI